MYNKKKKKWKENSKQTDKSKENRRFVRGVINKIINEKEKTRIKY